LRIASAAYDDITNSSCIVKMSIFKRLGQRFSLRKIDNSKCYSRCEMEPLPNEIYQDIVDFQSDVNRPIDISVYREFKKHAAWSPFSVCLVHTFFNHLAIKKI